jgi:hypothetical protein
VYDDAGAVSPELSIMIGLAHLFTLFLCTFAFLSTSPARAQSNAAFSGIDWGKYAYETIDVRVGLQIDQLTHIDQKGENFGVVGTIRLEWSDPNLAYEADPASRQAFRVFTGKDFQDFADGAGVLTPGYVILNRQGRLDIGDSTVVVFPDGKASFSERFTVTLQAPDFDFRKYPFDTQRFYVHLGFLLPKELMRLTEIEDFSGMGDRLGEEEWVVDKSWVEITEWETGLGLTGPKFSLGFSANRHLQYYLMRIFVPLGIIVLVTYSTFFMRDFTRRIEICTTTLLTFVAFNFAISYDLPRLGYLTFLDVVMGLSFVVIGLNVVWNVALRRLEQVGRDELARCIDAYTLWIYPVSQAALVYLAWIYVN